MYTNSMQMNEINKVLLYKYNKVLSKIVKSGFSKEANKFNDCI